jgi:putative hydrolase of the HAD superfamily
MVPTTLGKELSDRHRPALTDNIGLNVALPAVVKSTGRRRRAGRRTAKRRRAVVLTADRGQFRCARPVPILAAFGPETLKRHLMVDWDLIDTVLLDMDGTLLDLYFDSYLWKEHLPRRYAERNALDIDTAKREIVPRIRAREGTLQWYCLDYWTAELGIDISALEREVSHLIAVRPHAPDLLQFLRARRIKVVLTTNAHRRSLSNKLDRTGIGAYFDHIVSSHDYGVPKEHPAFWRQLNSAVPYSPDRTLLVDDNPSVLRSARDFGIRHLLAIRMPDSRGQPRAHSDFACIDSFLDLLPAA